MDTRGTQQGHLPAPPPHAKLEPAAAAHLVQHLLCSLPHSPQRLYSKRSSPKSNWSDSAILTQHYWFSPMQERRTDYFTIDFYDLKTSGQSFFSPQA